MNTEIRLDILIKSLEIENHLSKIIRDIIRIPKSETKTLGNQSSALSFKTKTDLLYDLDRITKDEYNLLILFMEIRNQFIHNLEANSFIKVFEILGNSKKNKILKIDTKVKNLYSDYEKMSSHHSKIEDVLKLGYDSLYQKLIKTILNQHQRLIEEFETESELEKKSQLNIFYADLIKIISETVNEFGELWTIKMEKLTGTKTEFKELLNAYVNQKSIEKIKKEYPDIVD